MYIANFYTGTLLLYTFPSLESSDFPPNIEIYIHIYMYICIAWYTVFHIVPCIPKGAHIPDIKLR